MMPCNLYEELVGYCGSDAYPFHMPGHKRRLGSLQDPFSFDITEIDGFDNLHHAEGILLEAEKRAAELYGSEETHFLVNGSTAGILSAVGSAVRRGGRILMARNSHKAAYHAAMLNALRVTYLMPEYSAGERASEVSGESGAYTGGKGPREHGTWAAETGGPIRPQDVEKALTLDRQIHKDDGDLISAVYITSPTYDGVVSDVKKISQIAHGFNIPLIVDEAHGAHFGMHEIFPESSVRQGADFVIHSLHKTLPSLTQTALIHVNGELADRRRLREMLDTYQTSSPSYVLMASIDNCVCMLNESGHDLFSQLAGNLDRFYASVSDLKQISCLHMDDPSKILLKPRASFMTARKLYDILREEYHLQPEMVSRTYVLMLCSIGDSEEGFRRLSHALHEIDAGPAGREGTDMTIAASGFLPLPEAVMTIAEARDACQEKTVFEQSARRISGEYIYLYPPGIPLITPGERIGPGLIRQILALRQAGYSLEGMDDHSLGEIWCIRE